MTETETDLDSDDDSTTSAFAFSLTDDELDALDCVLIDIESLITLDSYTDEITRPLLSFQALSAEIS